MQYKWIKMYLDIADRLAEESHAVRLKVGSVFVSPEGVMSTGINGMPAGGTNECETMLPSGNLVTKPEVSHSEENLFGKIMRQGLSSKDGYMFITHAPCINCAKIILNSGVKHVYYRNHYRSTDGHDWLASNGVDIQHESHLISKENNLANL